MLTFVTARVLESLNGTQSVKAEASSAHRNGAVPWQFHRNSVPAQFRYPIEIVIQSQRTDDRVRQTVQLHKPKPRAPNAATDIL